MTACPSIRWHGSGLPLPLGVPQASGVGWAPPCAARETVPDEYHELFPGGHVMSMAKNRPARAFGWAPAHVTGPRLQVPDAGSTPPSFAALDRPQAVLA